MNELREDALTESEIHFALDTQWAGRKLTVFKETDSTNIQAKLLAECGAAHGTLVIADCQTAGKGRRGRAWEAPGGKGIWMSLILRPDIPPDKASMLTIVAAHSVSHALSDLTGVMNEIKWPNDIILNEKKVCGILTEMSSAMGQIHFIVVGIGINVNIQSFPKELDGKATSLLMATGREFNRAEVVCKVLAQFEKDYACFLRYGDLTGLLDTYNELLINSGKEVVVKELNQEYVCIAESVNRHGKLIVQLPDGSKRKIFAGEVSVRGLHGYIS